MATSSQVQNEVTKIKLAAGYSAKSSENKIGYLLIALSIIGMIASLVGAGFLYSSLGFGSLAICFASVLLGALSVFASAKWCILRTDKPVESAPSNEPESPIIPTPPETPLRSEETTSQSQEPFNHLLKIKIEAKNPLMREMPLNSFLKISVSGDVLNFATGARLSKDNLDSELLNLPLTFWLNPDKADVTRYKHYTRVKNEERIKFNLINKRIEEFDKAIKLKTRLNRLKYSYAKVKDLLPAWPQSPLRFALLMDDELQSLKINALENQSNKMIWRVFGDRLVALSVKKKEFSLPAVLNKENIGNTLLLDLSKFQASQINACPENFPAIVFTLISKSELKQIATEKLSTEQLHFLFSKSYFDTKAFTLVYYIQGLEPNQINACIPLIKHIELFANLSQTQALHFDFKQIEINDRKKVFEIIYNSEGAVKNRTRAAQYFQKLKIEQINPLTPLFTENHWASLSTCEDHVINLDAKYIPHKKAFEILYDPSGISEFSMATRRFKKLGLEQIYRLIPLFSDLHWKCLALCEQHVKDFNLSEIDDEYKAMAEKYLPKNPSKGLLGLL